MNLKQLIQDEDGVSPVIGVILMVAITVILAAVIATFVLGLGEQVSSTSPQATINFDYDSEAGNGAITISHEGGDTIEAQTLFVTTEDTDFEDPSGSVVSSSQRAAFDEFDAFNTGSEITAGDTLNITATNNAEFDTAEVSVIFQSTEGDTSATLGEFSGPDA
jgi:archaeal flagellin N-terminal-like domain